MSKRNSFLYEDNHTREISFPLGGIGTGSIGLSGSGRLIDWEIFNRPNKGSTNGLSHFAVRAVRDGELLDARILNGPYFGSRTGDYTAPSMSRRRYWPIGQGCDPTPSCFAMRYTLQLSRMPCSIPRLQT
jgi:hypothetical protein